MVTVAMVAAHTPGLPYPPLGTGLQGLDLQRRPAIAAALAGAAPLWAPGIAMAYHPVTIGRLLDEIVQRATIAEHVRSLIAEPLGLAMWVGLPEALIGRVVPGRWEDVDPMEPNEEPNPPGSYAELRQQFLHENAPMDPDFDDPDQVRQYYRAERPAIAAITDPRSVATMYAATLQPVDRIRLITDATRTLATTPRTDDVETLIESGTAGPDYRVGFGYICSRMRDIGSGGDPRRKNLIDGITTCIEHI